MLPRRDVYINTQTPFRCPVRTRTALHFVEVVRQQRLGRGVAQEELASIADVERSHIGKIERGTHMPSLALIIKLGNVLQCQPGLLVDAAVKQMES